MIRAALAGALVLCLALRVGAGPPWTPSTFPNPKLDIDKCGRGVPSNICDPDQVISTAAANRVEGILKEIYEGADPYARAPCGSKGLEGYQVGLQGRQAIMKASTALQCKASTCLLACVCCALQLSSRTHALPSAPCRATHSLHPLCAFLPARWRWR